MSTTSYVTLPFSHLRPISRLIQTASIPPRQRSVRSRTDGRSLSSRWRTSIPRMPGIRTVLRPDVERVCLGGGDVAGRDFTVSISRTFPLFPLPHETLPFDYEPMSIIFNLLTMGVGGRYRYRLDVDGYGWSSRWQKLLTTNSVVLKSTIYVSPSPFTITDYLSSSRISLPLNPFYDLNDIADLDP